VTDANETVVVRVHGSSALPVLIYLPGIHCDWTLIASFRQRGAARVRFVEMAYPRASTWSLQDYSSRIEEALANAQV